MPTFFYPLKTSATGDLASSTDRNDIIKSYIRAHLDTIRGDRPLSPNFGLNASGIVFAPVISQNIAVLAEELRIGLARDCSIPGQPATFLVTRGVGENSLFVSWQWLDGGVGSSVVLAIG